MKNFNFELKQNLIIPASGDLQLGYFLFPAGEFGLTYFITPNARKGEISLSLCVVQMATDIVACTIGTYNITEQGFPVQVGEDIVYINKYSEVIQYFEGDGSLTEAGITWAKSTPFNGQTVGDFIV